jgi:hypothetical protein
MIYCPPHVVHQTKTTAKTLVKSTDTGIPTHIDNGTFVAIEITQGYNNTKVTDYAYLVSTRKNPPEPLVVSCQSEV